MKTATTEAEFKERLKEGKPFQIQGTAQVHIILLDPKKPPIIQIVGDSDDIFKMLSYAMSTIADSALAQGRSLEEIARTLHTLADAAMFATMEDMKRKGI